MKKESEKNDYSIENEGITKFQDYLYSKFEYGMGAGQDYRGAHGSVRPFIDRFMELPNKSKLRVMYLMENDLKGETLTDDMMEGYNPDPAKVISNLHVSRWKFWKRFSSSYLDFQKLKDCMDKEAKDAKIAKQMEAKKEVESVPNAEAPKTEDKPNLVLGKRHIGDVSYNIGAGITTIGCIAGYIGTKFSKIARVCSSIVSYCGAALTGLIIGKSVVEKRIVKNNLKELDTIKDDISKLKENPNLTEKQKENLSKLEQGSNIIRSINKNKVKCINADLVSNSVGTATAVLGTSTVAMAASVTIAVGAMVGAEIYKNKIASNDAREVVDQEIFKDKEVKEGLKTGTVTLLTNRYLRLSPEKQKKYEKNVNEFKNDDKKIDEAIRDEAVRLSGEVDLFGYRNKIVYDIGETTYKIMRDVEKSKVDDIKFNEVDEKIAKISEAIVKAAGGKKVDFSKMNLQHEITDEERELAGKNLSEKMSEMTLG